MGSIKVYADDHEVIDNVAYENGCTHADVVETLVNFRIEKTGGLA